MGSRHFLFHGKHMEICVMTVVTKQQRRDTYTWAGIVAA
jgi:hypothetical protein